MRELLSSKDLNMEAEGSQGSLCFYKPFTLSYKHTFIKTYNMRNASVAGDFIVPSVLQTLQNMI
jgi:hypothetical protein